MGNATSGKEGLTPPDKERCQADVIGNGPFTMGGEIGDPKNGYRIRCKNVPTVIATENKPGSDGLIGSMSLCDECKQVFMRLLGEDFASFKGVEA